MAYMCGSRKRAFRRPLSLNPVCPFVVGTAPVHSAESPAALFTPVLCTDWEDAVKKLGYSDDWKTYTICEVMYSHFKLFQRQPIIFCNVLDPSTNKEAVAGAEVTLSGKQAKLPFDAILSSLVVKTASSSESPLVKDTDYAAYYSDGNLIVETIEDGAAKAATKLYISYDKIKTADIDDDDIVKASNHRPLHGNRQHHARPHYRARMVAYQHGAGRHGGEGRSHQRHSRRKVHLRY